MKNKISFLAILALTCGANCANASECVGEDCELTPVAVDEVVKTVDVLQPTQYEINWLEEPAEQIESHQVCQYDYNCPFESATECEIWYRKPIHKTTLSPRAPHINPVRVDDMLYAIYSNYNISGNDVAMSPLLERYEILMRASNACCSEGIIYKMRAAGLSDAKIYSFMKDDANYFAVMQRCMVMDNTELDQDYSNGVTSKMVIDVRNACLCKNRQWFTTLLQPFNDIYYRAPQFESAPFTYNYTDGMKRNVSVSINRDIQITSGILNECPK